MRISVFVIGTSFQVITTTKMAEKKVSRTRQLGEHRILGATFFGWLAMHQGPGTVIYERSFVEFPSDDILPRGASKLQLQHTPPVYRAFTDFDTFRTSRREEEEGIVSNKRNRYGQLWYRTLRRERERGGA